LREYKEMKKFLVVLIGSIVSMSCGEGSNSPTQILDRADEIAQEEEGEFTLTYTNSEESGLEIEAWLEYSFHSVNPYDPINVAACICEVNGPSKWDQTLVGVLHRTIPTGSHRIELNEVESFLTLPNCKVQVDLIRNGACSCPTPGGELLAYNWFWKDRRYCPIPTPSPTPSPYPTPTPSPSPSPSPTPSPCLQQELVGYRFSPVNEYVIGHAVVTGEGKWEIQIRAGSEENYLSDNPKWIKDRDIKNLGCYDSKVRLAVKYKYKHHSATHWWMNIYFNDVLIERSPVVIRG
jgi:hypothetical protein